MLTVKELRKLARTLPLEQFRHELGPFALIQRSPKERGEVQTNPFGLPSNAAATSAVRPEEASAGTLTLLFEFEDLAVATLPPVGDRVELSVGRQPDCDLLVNDSSVSKRHAVLEWHEDTQHCTVRDTGSTNGTFLNLSTLVKQETQLRDGDILTFGEVPFWYLLTETLFEKLRTESQTKGLGSHTG